MVEKPNPMVGLVTPPRTPRKDCINKPLGRRGHFGAQPCLAVALITSTLLLRPRVHKRASSTHRGCHWEGFTIATNEACCILFTKTLIEGPNVY